MPKNLSRLFYKSKLGAKNTAIAFLKKFLLFVLLNDALNPFSSNSFI